MGQKEYYAKNYIGGNAAIEVLHISLVSFVTDGYLTDCNSDTVLNDYTWALG